MANVPQNLTFDLDTDRIVRENNTEVVQRIFYFSEGSTYEGTVALLEAGQPLDPNLISALTIEIGNSTNDVAVVRFDGIDENYSLSFNGDLLRQYLYGMETKAATLLVTVTVDGIEHSLAGVSCVLAANPDDNTGNSGGISFVPWEIITDKPSTFPPSSHEHPIADVTGLQTALDDVETALDGKAATSHSHAISDVTDLQTTLDGKVRQITGSMAWTDFAHYTTYVYGEGFPGTKGVNAARSFVVIHNAGAGEFALAGTALAGPYYFSIPPGDTVAITTVDQGGGNFAITQHSRVSLTAWAGITGKPSTFTPSSHSHAIADVTGLQTAIDGKAPTSHTHTIANVTGLQTAIDGKAATVHSHAISDTTGLQTALDGKAASSHTHTASNISDSTTAGRAMLTASTADAQRSLLGLAEGDNPTFNSINIDDAVIAASFAVPDGLELQPTIQAATPTTGQTVTVNSNETVTTYLTPAGTLATLTFTLPSNANSTVGQTVRLFTTQAITALTVNVASSGTLVGSPLISIAANQGAIWQKVSSSSNGTWLRISNDATPSGSVMHFAANTAPAGWLKANGAAISRTTYAALFAVTGTTYGTGDGSTTFNLPDLRAEFIRGWDDSRGVDSGRTFGNYSIG